MPTLTNVTIPTRFNEWLSASMTISTSGTGTLGLDLWTTASDATYSWTYHVANTLPCGTCMTDTSHTTANSLTVSNGIWRVWNDTYQQSWEWRWQVSETAPPAPRVLTPAEVEAERQREEARWQRQREREQHRRLINGRADRLLRQHLTAEQRATFERYGFFIVVSESGQRYRVRHGYARNIDLLDAHGKAITTYCAHPGEALPGDFETGWPFRGSWGARASGRTVMDGGDEPSRPGTSAPVGSV